MNKATTIFLLILALAAVIFLSIYIPLTRQARAHDAVVQSGRVLNIDPSAVHSIRISTGKRVLELRRQGNGWRLGSKFKDRADTAVVNKLLTLAANLGYEDRVAAGELSAETLDAFALRNPKRKIEFEGPDMSKVTLFLGRDAAGENRIYVREEGPSDVFVVPEEIMTLAFQDDSDFRDRRLTNLNFDDIERFIIRREGGEIELWNSPSGWQITRPLHTPADPAKVRDYLEHLLGLRITAYIGGDSGDLGVFGIAEGQDEITLYPEGESRPQTIRLGANRDGGTFGQFTPRDSIYRLPVEARKFVETTPADLRDRKILRLNPDVVDKIRFQLPHDEFAIRRGDSEQSWLVRHGDTTRPVGKAAVLALWDALAKTDVLSYLPLAGAKTEETALKTPLATIEFIAVLSENTPETGAGDQTVAKITLARLPNGTVCARLGDSPEVAILPPEILDGIPLDPKNWASPH